MYPYLVYFYRIDWRAGLLILVGLTVYVLWERYTAEHDNWLTRLVEWFNDHSETIMIICCVIVLIVALVATIFLVYTRS